VKLGGGGETTLSTVDPYLPWEGRGAAYHCDFPHGSQLAEVVSFLHAHAGFIRAVTIDIGGNDFLEFGEQAPVEHHRLHGVASVFPDSGGGTASVNPGRSRTRSLSTRTTDQGIRRRRGFSLIAACGS
jgi:hypothetical protein